MGMQLSGSLELTGSFTTSGAIVAQTLVVQTITSSITQMTGSNVFGSSLSNTQRFTGSVLVTGSFAVTTTGTELQVVNTGVRIGNALSDSHIISGSLTVNPSGLFVSSSGNVGIGTISPSQKFEVVGGEVKAGRVDTNQEGGQVSFGRALDNNTSWYIDLYGSSTSPQLRFVNVDNSVVAMTVTGSNVGIGTSTPQQKLHVEGDVYLANNRNLYFANTGVAAGAIRFYNATSGTTKSAIGSYYNVADEGDLEFLVGASLLTKFIIRSNGRSIFNSTTDRGYQLQVNGDSSSYAVEFRQSNDNASYDLLTLTHEATSGNRRMVVFNTGGIGTVGTIISTNSSTTYNTSSDYRLKEDLKDFNGLDKISAIKVYDFKWKVDDSRMEGVLAHELQEVIPYAVYGEKDELDQNGKPKMQGVDYSKIVPVLIKAIQELEARVKELENK